MEIEPRGLSPFNQEYKKITPSEFGNYWLYTADVVNKYTKLTSNLYKLSYKVGMDLYGFLNRMDGNMIDMRSVNDGR